MFDDFLTNPNSWLNGQGPFAEIVFSSRVRLARNLAQYPFPSQANPQQLADVLRQLKEVYPKVKLLKNSTFVKLSEINDVDRQFLLERHLISQEHLESSDSKGLIVSNDEGVALMVNEEDHLRMQVIASGFNLQGSWRLLNDIEDELSKFVSFAFLPEFGYLTACPTNVGTALRASCMLHLPALILTKRINKILELLAKISVTTRGFFGEGTQALGNFFQISNQISLGLSEKELIENLSGVVNQVKEQEIDARQYLLKKHKISLEDSVWRALGALRTSRLMSSKEALGHLSLLSLGLNLGIIKNISKEVVNNLFIIIQPAHLQKLEGRQLEEEGRDYIRATLLREKLKGDAT